MGGGHSWREGGRVKAGEREGGRRVELGREKGGGVKAEKGERERGKKFQSWGEREGGIIDGRERGVIARARGVKVGERAGRHGHSWGKRRGVKAGERERGERGIQELSTCLLRSEKSY